METGLKTQESHVARGGRMDRERERERERESEGEREREREGERGRINNGSKVQS